MNAEILKWVPQEKRDAAEVYLKNRAERPSKLVQILLFVGAFFGSLFIIAGSLISGGYLSFSITGVCFIVLGWFIIGKNENESDASSIFFTQLGITISMAGRIMLIWRLLALADYQQEWNILISAAVAAAGYPFFKAKIDRLFFCAWPLCLTVDYFMGGFWHSILPSASFNFYLWPWAEKVFCLFLFGFALWVLAARWVRLKPLAYACLIACAYGLAIQPEMQEGLSRVLAAGMAAYCASRLPLAFKMRALICGLIAVMACWLNVPAFLGLFACAAGYVLRERIVEWLGLVGFGAGLVWLYYDMQATLLQKSGWLVLCGACALTAYVWVRRKYAR